MNTYYDSFLNYLRYERNYSAHTLTAYQEDLKQFEAFLQHAIQETDATDQATLNPCLVDADIIRNWIIHLLDKGINPRTVNRKLSSLKSFFKFLVKQQAIDSSPMRSIKGPKTREALPTFIREKDIERILAEENYTNDFEGIRDRLIMETLYQTGIRRSELINIKTSDVDLSAYILKVLGKRNKERLIPFAERLRKMIVTYSEIRKETIEYPSEWFFVQKNGNQLTVAIVYNIVRERLSDIPALSKRSPHVLRHSFATSMLNNGAELNAVKELLGHSSLASTSVYTHMTFEELKRMYHAHPRAKK